MIKTIELDYTLKHCYFLLFESVNASSVSSFLIRDRVLWVGKIVWL